MSASKTLSWCAAANIFSCWKRWREYTHVGPGRRGSVVWRCFYWGHTFHTVGKRSFFFCVFCLFFYPFFLLLFCFVSFFFYFWSQKSVVKMRAILYPDSLRAFPACFLNSLSLSISSQLVCLIFIVWTTWKMAQQKTVASILHFFFFFCMCVFINYASVCVFRVFSCCSL